MPSKPDQTQPVPDPVEWDFSSIPEGEIQIALAYECARSVDWIREDWQTFLDTQIPEMELHEDAAGRVLIPGSGTISVGAALAAGRFTTPHPGLEIDWNSVLQLIPQRLAGSWFVEVLALLPEFPTPWLKLPAELRSKAAKWFSFGGNDSNGFSIYAPGEPLPTQAKPFSFTGTELKIPSSFPRKLRRGKRPIDQWLKHKLSLATKLALAFLEKAKVAPARIGPLIGQDLNAVIEGPPIYGVERFAGVGLRPVTRKLIAQQPKNEKLARLNRLLLEDAYPQGLARHKSAKVKAAALGEDFSIFTMRINWNRNKVAIVRKFESWLDEQLKQRGIKTDRSRSGNASASHFPKLNWLGQMRLLDAVGYELAMDTLEQRSRAVRPVNSSQTLGASCGQAGMSRNKAKIVKLVKKWFPEPLPAERFPFGGYTPVLNR